MDTKKTPFIFQFHCGLRHWKYKNPITPRTPPIFFGGGGRGFSGLLKICFLNVLRRLMDEEMYSYKSFPFYYPYFPNIITFPTTPFSRSFDFEWSKFCNLCSVPFLFVLTLDLFIEMKNLITDRISANYFKVTLIFLALRKKETEFFFSQNKNSWLNSQLAPLTSLVN